MAKARVTVDNNFRLFDRDTRQAVEKGLGKSASRVVSAARGETGRYPAIRGITSSIRAGSAKRTGTSTLGVDVGYGDHRGNFFESGTYQRKGSLKKGGDPEGPNRGIKPVRSLRKALKDVRPRMIGDIQDHMGRWKA